MSRCSDGEDNKGRQQEVKDSGGHRNAVIEGAFVTRELPNIARQLTKRW